MIIRQAELCRRLVTDIAEHRVCLHEQGVDARSRVMPPCMKLPAHVSVMGISAMLPSTPMSSGVWMSASVSTCSTGELLGVRPSLFAQTTARFMCMSVIVACTRLRFVLPALVVLCLQAHGFTTAWTAVVAEMLERGSAKSLDPAWSLCLEHLFMCGASHD
jgi:hypothetical protein